MSRIFISLSASISTRNLPHLHRVENGVKHHFAGLSEKGHCPPEYTETPRLQVGHQVLPGLPFFKKKEPVFILGALAEFATTASLLRPYGADQQSNRLGQLHVLLGKDLHSEDEQNHTYFLCNWPADKGKKVRSVGSFINNRGLEK